MHYIPNRSYHSRLYYPSNIRHTDIKLNKCYVEITKSLFPDPIQVAAYMFKRLKKSVNLFLCTTWRRMGEWWLGFTHSWY